MIDWRRARVWLKHKAGSADANFFEISPSFAQISEKKICPNFCANFEKEIAKV